LAQQPLPLSPAEQKLSQQGSVLGHSLAQQHGQPQASEGEGSSLHTSGGPEPPLAPLPLWPAEPLLPPSAAVPPPEAGSSSPALPPLAPAPLAAVAPLPPASGPVAAPPVAPEAPEPTAVVLPLELPASPLLPAPGDVSGRGSGAGALQAVLSAAPPRTSTLNKRSMRIEAS
jgi:hypothetical protein